MDKTSMSNWERIGFQRPLAGFLLVQSLLLVLILPVIGIFHFFTTNIQPFTQSVGISWWVGYAFELAFHLLDLGTSVAMVKYFSQYRVSDPSRAMTYVQFYVWFQLISGITQIGLISILVAHIAPHTTYAFFTWFFILHTLVQFPGFVIVFSNIFQALQRYDLMVLMRALPLLVAGLAGLIGMVIMRRWGMTHPAYGEVLGATFGSAITGFLSQWLIMGVAMLIYWRLGFSLKVVLLAHFDWDTIKRALSFGVRYMPGEIAPFMTALAQPFILSLWLNNYLELNSLLTVAILFVNFAMRLPARALYSNLLPSISEAFSHGRMALSRLYIDQGLKWSLAFIGAITPLFLVIADKVIFTITPPQWARAAEYIVLGMIYGIMDFLGRLPDETFLGAGFPRLYSVINVGEHILRVLVMIALVPVYGVRGVLYAFIIGALIKCIVAWLALSIYVFRPRISWWPSVIVPIIVMIINYSLARMTVTFLPTETPQQVLRIVFLFAALAPSFYFTVALFGFFDNKTLAEYRDALKLNGITRTLGQVFYWPAYWGARFSPLHGRFPMREWEEGRQEALSLTEEKVEL